MTDYDFGGVSRRTGSWVDLGHGYDFVCFASGSDRGHENLKGDSAG
jgi:hypothetical protein